MEANCQTTVLWPGVSDGCDKTGQTKRSSKSFCFLPKFFAHIHLLQSHSNHSTVGRLIQASPGLKKNKNCENGFEPHVVVSAVQRGWRRGRRRPYCTGLGERMSREADEMLRFSFFFLHLNPPLSPYFLLSSLTDCSFWPPQRYAFPPSLVRMLCTGWSELP